MDHITFDWKGLSYDEVDERVHMLADIPQNKPFCDMVNSVFRGTVKKGNEAKVFDAIEFAHRKFRGGHIARSDLESSYRGFRNETFFGSMIPTSKPLHGRRYKNKIIFDVSEYGDEDDTTHAAQLDILKHLAKIWEADAVSVNVYSIVKDTHNLASRDSRLPFVRSLIGLLIVALPE